MKDLALICIAVVAILIGAWCAMTVNNELRNNRDHAAALEEENTRLSGEVESLTVQLASMRASKKETERENGSENQEEASFSGSVKLVHTRNRNLVYPEKYSITLDGFEELEINEEDIILELGDFGYEHGIEIASAKCERALAMNVTGTVAFTVSINGNEEEVIGCICYKDGGMVMLYDGSIQSAEEGNVDMPAPSPTASPTAASTTTPETTAPQDRQESTQTTQIEHIYDPETLSINDIPNGLYEAILDRDEMRNAIYQYMYANHIYDGQCSIDEDYTVNGPYYDFRVVMSNDSRDIYVRYDSGSNRYYCGFNEF